MTVSLPTSFSRSWKALEGKDVEAAGRGDAAAALTLVRECAARRP